MKKNILWAIILISFSFFGFCSDLKVLVATPQGALENLERFDSIQILFSQKMFNTFKESGKISVLPSFISIEPPFEAISYWSNDRLLKIVPKSIGDFKPGEKIKVTVKKGTRSLEGGVLKNDYTFYFVVPSLKVVEAEVFRKDSGQNSSYIVGLFFNYDIEPEQVAKCLKLSFVTDPNNLQRPFVSNYETKQIVDKRESSAAIKYKEKINFILNRPEKEAFFHLLDPKNEEIKRFINEASLAYFLKKYSERRVLLIKTDDVIPIQSLIKVDFSEGGYGCYNNILSKPTILIPPKERNALFFMGLSSSYYGESYTDTFSSSEEILLHFTKDVSEEECFKNLKVYDLTDEKELQLSLPKDLMNDNDGCVSLNRMGFKPESHKYLLRIDENLKAKDGENLGYPAYAMFSITLSPAYVSFGEGEGVWERARGTTVPFYARNVKKVRQNIVQLKKEDIAQILKKGFSYFDYNEEESHNGKRLLKGKVREIKRLKPEKLFNAGIDLKPYLSDDGYGIVFAEVEIEEPIENAPLSRDYYWRAKKSIIQVSDLGITLKYGVNDFLVIVTSLSKGDGVPNCEVEIRDFENRVLYAGVTDNNGVLKVNEKLLSSTDEYSSYYSQKFLVFAKKGNDLAYIVNNWCDGLEPWNFDVPYTWNIMKTPKITGIVFLDRGVYKLQEEVHFKAILRKKQKGDLVLFPKGTKVEVKLYDSRGKVREQKESELSSLGGIDGVFKIAKEYPLGNYAIEVSLENQKISVGFLVAAYRKPEFRVNVDIEKKEGKIEGKISSSYLFGSPLSEGKVKYIYEENSSYLLPDSVRNNYKPYVWDFFPYYYERDLEKNLQIRKEGEATLDKNGEFKLSFNFAESGIGKSITLEAEVEDITKQAISNRSNIIIYPDYFVGIYVGNWGFYDYKEGLKTRIVVVDKEGNTVKGRNVELILKKVVYKSAQFSTGYNYYDWESRRDYEVISKKEIESDNKSVDVSFDLPSGGEYILVAQFSEKDKTYYSSTNWYFYGGGYTPWERYTSNKIDLLVEKPSYNVGETAKIMVQSPWQKARMVVTKERDTIRSVEVKELNSTQEILEIPITENDVPNVFISVVLIKGRLSKEEQDKPQIRIGYAQIFVGKEQKKLNIKIESDKEEYKPAEKCKVKINIKDPSGRNAAGAEVTLWAVDVGVLNLTNYKTPELLGKLYKEENLSIFNADSREKLISARVTSPKGEDEGGGGGAELGSVDQVRKDFRVLAFWVGSALTDSEGNFAGEFLLPESLTSFRIMAVAHTKDNLFGSSEKEFRVAKSLMVNPYFPRFLVVEDTALARVLVNSRIDKNGKCKVKMESLTPEVLLVQNGEAEGDIVAKGKKEFKFKIIGRKTGKAKVRVSSEGLEEKDAFEVEIPVIVPHNGYVRVDSGSFVGNKMLEGNIPQDVYNDMGEMSIEVSTNILTQFSESYEFVVKYPYGCAEQRSSALTTLLNNYKFARSIGKTGGSQKEAENVIITGIKALEPFQNDDGGFGVWVTDKISFPYLSAYIGKLLVDAQKEGLLENKEILEKTIDYLNNISKQLKSKGEETESENEALALAAKVLAEYGVKVDTILTRLSSNLGSLETITLCHLWDAAVVSGKKDLAREIESVVKSRLLIKGQEAHLRETYNENYYYYWYSSDIATATALKSFVTNTQETEIIEQLTYGLLVREQNIDHFNYNTHRNSYVYEALAAYAIKFNQEQKETNVSCKVNGKKIFNIMLTKEDGWTSRYSLPIKELLKYSTTNFKIEFESKGNSAIHYLVKLKWYPAKLLLDKEERGFKVKRKFLDLVTKEEKKSFKAGDLIEVQIEVTPEEDSTNVVVVDPLPAGFEVHDASFATTSKKLNDVSQSNESQNYDYFRGYYYYYRGRFNYIEKYDDKVLLFANYLYCCKPIKFSYVVRATTEGDFRLQGPSVYCMYNEQVRGSSEGSVIKVGKE